MFKLTDKKIFTVLLSNIFLFIATAAEVGEERTAPDFTTELEDVRTTDGGQAVLECVIAGFPRPTITWLKDDVLVEESEEFKLLYDQDNVCSLTIPDVYPEDAGRYTVVAKNELGSAMSTAELFVEGKNMVFDEAPLALTKNLVKTKGA